MVGQDLTAVEMASDRCAAHGIPFFRISPVGINVRIDQVPYLWLKSLKSNSSLNQLNVTDRRRQADGHGVDNSALPRGQPRVDRLSRQFHELHSLRA